MKRIALKASTALMALALLASCGAKQADNDGAGQAAAPAEQKSDKALPNIRYIDADSISSAYKLAQEFQQKTLATVSKIESATQARQAELQKLGSSIEQKTRNNEYLTKESYEGDMNRFGKMQNDAAATIDKMQRQAQQEMAQRQIELNDSLESFIRDYNAKKGYDAILYKAAGVYFNPALDITQEVIEGLNARYEKSHPGK